MEPVIVAALIGAAGTTLGAVLGRSEYLDRLLRDRSIADLRGDWKSTWKEPDSNGQPTHHEETITITKMRGSRVEGTVKSAHYEGKPCQVEGVFSGRFLLLLWQPAKETKARLIDDYGCYFLEKKADGSFEGRCVGYFEHLNRVAGFEHVVKRVGTP